MIYLLLTFPKSIALPPPIAITPSHLYSKADDTADTASTTVGSSSTAYLY
jgi:hypothetical protein